MRLTYMRTRHSEQFSTLCGRFNFKIVPVMNRINGEFTKRPDILAVEKNGQWVMTIPRDLYAFKSEAHADLGGRPHPGYYDCETKLYNEQFYDPRP